MAQVKNALGRDAIILHTRTFRKGGILGFFLLSSGPIGFQYGAEITYPASEGSSNGLLLMMGQISGIAFIFGMDIFKSKTDGSMGNPLMVLIGLMVISLIASTRLKESVMVGKPEPADLEDLVLLEDWKLRNSKRL